MVDNKNKVKLALGDVSNREQSLPILERYYNLLKMSAESFEVAPEKGDFEPAVALPELDDRVRRYLSVATASFVELGEYHGMPIRLLDLRQNPGTQTTKTFAATLIVLRAVHHIQQTGQSIVLFSPSSGNKAIALRDAVERALACALVAPEQLRVVTLTPRQTQAKLRRSRLYDDPKLRSLNPVFVLDNTVAEAVKQVGQVFKLQFAEAGFADVKLWHSLRLENYRFADQARAFFDLEFGSAGDVGRRTLHVHAVSSAYGLLGYMSGVQTLRALGHTVADPAFLLVQHLATSDMVRHLMQGNFGNSGVPAYVQAANGLWQQSACVHYPAMTWSTEETLEPTFYTHQPVTAREMSALIKSNGGSGIVVSLYECMQRYAEIAQLLKSSSIQLPADPRQLQEWSLVMALTGCLNAIDRGLIKGQHGCTVHASGSYAEGDYQGITQDGCLGVSNAEEMVGFLRQNGF
jgi:hypothetical protein